jgi:hypothetical protein
LGDQHEDIVPEAGRDGLIIGAAVVGEGEDGFLNGIPGIPTQTYVFTSKCIQSVPTALNEALAIFLQTFHLEIRITLDIRIPGIELLQCERAILLNNLDAAIILHDFVKRSAFERICQL